MKIFYRSTVLLLALVLFTLNLNAQVAEGKQTVALLEFEGRGIPVQVGGGGALSSMPSLP